MVETALLVRALGALFFIALLIGFCAWVAKRFLTRFGYPMGPGPAKRLQTEETLMLDAKHRLFLVKIDDQEMVILTSHHHAPTMMPLASLSVTSTPLKYKL